MPRTKKPPAGPPPPVQQAESFTCPHCGKHIPDAVPERYVARLYLSRRKKGSHGGGRPRSITDDVIRRIRKDRRAKMTLSDTAEKYEISISAVRQITGGLGAYAKRHDGQDRLCPCEDCRRKRN